MTDYLVTELPYRGHTLCVAALYEDGQLVSLRAEAVDRQSLAGTVVKAYVDSVVKNIGGAFVCIDKGGTKAYLPAKRSRQLTASRPVLVQISGDASGLKEAVATENISIAGRLAVVTHRPAGVPGGISFSAKLTAEQKRVLRSWLAEHPCPEYGLLVRTNAAWTEKHILLEEIRRQAGILTDILHRYPEAAMGEILYRPERFFVEEGRDLYAKPDRFFCDIPAYREEVAACLDAQYGGGVEVGEGGPGTMSLAELYNLTRDLDRLLQKKVWLKSGGFLVIEKTEAFVSIDVNTGRMEKGRIPEETYRRANLEAAEEIAKQMRLRNLSGMILVDFISMEHPDHRDELLHVMKKLVRKDHIHTDVIDITPLGIMEIVRRKVRKPLAEELD